MRRRPGWSGRHRTSARSSCSSCPSPHRRLSSRSVIPRQLLQTEDEEEEARNSHRPTEVSPGQSILHPCLPPSFPASLPSSRSSPPSRSLPSPPALILPNIPLSSPLLSSFQPFFHPFLLLPSPTSFPPFLSSLFVFQSLTLQLIFSCLLSIFISPPSQPHPFPGGWDGGEHPCLLQLSGFRGFWKIGLMYQERHCRSENALQFFTLSGLRVKLDRVLGTGRNRVQEQSMDMCYKGWGWGGCHFRCVSKRPPLPSSAVFSFLFFFFSSWELLFPSMYHTNLKPSFLCFDCRLHEKPQGKRSPGKGTREKEGRGGEGWQQWKPVSLPLGLSGVTFSSHRPNIQLDLNLCVLGSVTTYFTNRNSLNFNAQCITHCVLLGMQNTRSTWFEAIGRCSFCSSLVNFKRQRMASRLLQNETVLLCLVNISF